MVILCADMGYRYTLFAENFQRLATGMGYTDTSGLGCGGVLIDPNVDGAHYVWRLPWPEKIIAELVSTDNPHGLITHSYLDLEALVLQEATFTFVSANLEWQSPFTGSNNTPTVAWTFWEASTVNLVVANLFRLQSLVN